jgi:hypothetical protein
VLRPPARLAATAVALVSALAAGGCLGLGGGDEERPAASGGCPPAELPAPPDIRPRYAMRVKLDPKGLVTGTMRVTFPATAPTDRLVFRLWANGSVEKQHGARLDVDDVMLDGGPVAAERPDPTTLVVPLGRTLEPGDSATASLGFRLVVPNGEGGFPDRIQLADTWMRLGSFFPILAWDGKTWRTDPAPKIPGESSTSPTSDFDVRIAGPAGWTVLATGDPEGGGRWKADAVRDFSVVAGKLDVTEKTVDTPDPVRVVFALARFPQRQLLGTGLDRAAQSLVDLSRRYGPYPWRRFTVALFPDLAGNGIEYPMLVTVGPQGIPTAIPHEAGHQWFYSLVGNDQGADPWLDEGLATWSGARVEGTAEQFRTFPVPQDVRGHLGEPMSYWASRPQDYFAGVYAQGAKALATLGPAALVDCALRGYAAANAYRVAGEEDLATALERVFPDARRTLERFGALRSG